jgi:dipeptidyl aminopeptidase/acylaminoacyl peptidase
VLSPDCRHLAALSPYNGRINLTIYDVKKRSAVRLTNLTGSNVNSVSWANNKRVIFTTGNQQGRGFRGDGGLFAIDIDGNLPVTLVKPFVTGTSMSRVPRITTVLRRLDTGAEEILVSTNDQSFDSQDVYRMIVVNGRKSLVNASSPGNVVSWALDPDNLPRAAYCMDVEKRKFWFAYLVDLNGRDWKSVAQWDEQLNQFIIPIAFDPAAPNLIFVASKVGRDTLALFDFDTTTGKLNDLIHGDDRYDVFPFLLLGVALGDGGRLIFGGTEEKPSNLIGLVYQAEKPKFVWFDEAAAKAHASMSTSLPGNVTSFDVNAPRSQVFTRSDTNPGEYYLYDRETRALEDADIRIRPEINPKAMRPMQTVSWIARDGLRIDGGFNWSIQRTDHCVGRRSVADEVPDTNLLHGRPEGIDVGAMEGRLDASPACSAVQSSTHFGAGNPIPDWRHLAAGTEPLCNRADAGRERGDLARHGGWSIDSFGCCTDRTSAINSQPRDHAYGG